MEFLLQLISQLKNDDLTILSNLVQNEISKRGL